MRGQPLNDMTHPVLRELPVFEPDAKLWSRIEAAHEKSLATPAPRRAWRGMGFAAAAAIAVAIGVVATMPHAPRDASLVDGQSESQTLEREWRALPVASVRPAAGLARLHVIDAALQAAYDRGAAPSELTSLWKQRNEALRGLILVAGTDEVTRI
jgi:hypothetical protein